MKSRLIVAGSWQNDLFDTNKSDGSPPGRAFVTTERDGYFLFPPANRKVHSSALANLDAVLPAGTSSVTMLVVVSLPTKPQYSTESTADHT
jgi:hypothetical protein